MAIYRYQPESLIDEFRILINESGGARAYLHAREGADSETLHAVKAAVDAKGWKCVATTYEGKPVLEVRGFKKPEEAVSFIQDSEWSKGEPTVIAEATDARSKSEKWRNATLKAAGISYNVGDLGYMYYAVEKFRMKGKEYKADVTAAEQLARREHQSFNVLDNPTLQGPRTSKQLLSSEALAKAKGDARIYNGLNKLDIAGGIGYAAGSTALTVYGGRDHSQNIIEDTSEKISRFLSQQQVDTHENSTLKHINTEPKRSFFGKLDRFMEKYPSETLNGIYVFVGGALTLVGMFHVFEALKSGDKKALRTEIIETGLGFTTAASAIAGLTIKEKKPVEGEEKKKGLGRVWQWIEEKPLRATGLGYAAATAFHAVGTVNKYRDGDAVIRKTIVGRGVFVAANIFSEAMLFFSSKGHGSGVKPDASVDQTIIAATADTIAHQPVERQEALIRQLSGYMAMPEIMGGKADEIAESLRKEMAALTTNPWSRHALNETPAVTTVSPQHEPEVQKVLEKRADTPGTKISTAQHMEMLQQPKELAMAAH